MELGWILNLAMAVAALVTLGDYYSVKGAPISGVPIFHTCQEVVGTYNVSSTVEKTISWNCCLKPVDKVIEFSSLEPKARKGRKAKLRFRKAAHLMSPKEIERYRRAYELMKALPADDPRSFFAQAKIHCAYCEGAYKYANGLTMQMHFSWLFLPWHRMYLYFHERILQSLLGDPSFSLVYWNWDDQITGGNVIPAMFAQEGTSLYDKKRDPASLPPNIAKLSVSFNTTNPSVLVQENLNVMYQAVVTPKSANLFMGRAYRYGMNISNSSATYAPLGGSLENGPHDAVHYWVGDSREPLRQDMTAFSTTARDPIFYAHHGNLDRLWEVWRYNMHDGPRHVHTDPDFLNSEFAFYDENANLVKVKIKDTLDTSKLGYKYTPAKGDLAWIHYNPIVVSNQSSNSFIPNSNCVANDGNFEISKKLTIMVKRQSYNHSKDDNQILEVLSIEGIGVENIVNGLGSEVGRMLVFVNFVEANDSTSTNCAEYVGTVTFLPSLFRLKPTMNVKFEIGDNLQRIGFPKDGEYVAVTLVVVDVTKVTVQNIQIVLE